MQCKRIQCCVCVVFSAKNKETRMKFKCQECNIGLFATPCFEVHHTELHFWGSADTKMEKWNTQMSINTNHWNGWNDISVVSSWLIMGMNEVWILQKGLMKDERLVRGAYMWGTCFTSPIWEKNRKQCLEMSVNNS